MIVIISDKHCRNMSDIFTQDDLDLTGSPLKCSFTLDDHLDLEVLPSTGKRSKRGGGGEHFPFIPMSAQDARSVILEK